MSQNNVSSCDANGCNEGMQLRSQTNRQLRTKRQKDIKELFEKLLATTITIVCCAISKISAYYASKSRANKVTSSRLAIEVVHKHPLCTDLLFERNYYLRFLEAFKFVDKISCWLVELHRKKYATSVTSISAIPYNASIFCQNDRV